MYAAFDLKQLINKLQLEQSGRELKGICPVCKNKSLFLNKGRKKVSIIVCNNCITGCTDVSAKKREIVDALQMTWDDFGPELDIKEIDAIWDEVFPDAKNTDNSNRLDLADVGICDRAYTYLLTHKACKLVKLHREWLESRGLPADYAESLCYGSTPSMNTANTIANELYLALGEDLLKVPGFVKEANKIKVRMVSDGIFHPCRNLQGEIVSVKIRRPNATNKDRLITMSSASSNGPSALAVCHIPLNVNKLKDTTTVWVTEGERKADIVFKVKQQATIGVPGTQNIGMAFPVLEELNCKTLIFALDKDKAGEYATIKLRYEHYVRELEHREFLYADWPQIITKKDEEKK